MKVILTVGLPASGKTTWASNQVISSNGQTKRINKDELRAMVDSNNFSKSNEKMILKIRDLMIVEYLKSKINVIIDDTNLNSRHLEDIEKLVKDNFPDENITVVENTSFLKVPVDECIKRDSRRLRVVGENVIMKMVQDNGYRFEFLKWTYNNREGFPAIICDIDGTLANNSHRSPYDLTKCESDSVVQHIKDLIDLERNNGTQIIFVSGRSEESRDNTTRWLESNSIKYECLYMRPKGDKSPDDSIKYEIFKKHILPQGLYIKYVLDDRNRVVDMWRNKLYLNCFQVNYGDF